MSANSSTTAASASTLTPALRVDRSALLHELLHGLCLPAGPSSIATGAHSSSDGYTALHFAAWNGQVHTLDLLLQLGADADPVAADSRTPLHLAAVGGHADCVRLLLSRGADAERRILAFNPYAGLLGGTALREAVLNQRWEVIEQLIMHGADVRVLCEPCTFSPIDSKDFFAVVMHLGPREPALQNRFDPQRLVQLAARAHNQARHTPASVPLSIQPRAC